MTEDEEKKILDYVSYTCAKNGYASLSDVPLGDIEERNYKLSHIAIYNAIYKKIPYVRIVKPREKDQNDSSSKKKRNK